MKWKIPKPIDCFYLFKFIFRIERIQSKYKGGTNVYIYICQNDISIN